MNWAERYIYDLMQENNWTKKDAQTYIHYMILKWNKWLKKENHHRELANQERLKLYKGAYIEKAAEQLLDILK